MHPEELHAAHTGSGAPATSTVTDSGEHREYWESFYHSRTSVAVPNSPSPFARWVAQWEPAGTSLVDVGSGTGRDTLWFAREGFRCMGLDYAEAAVESATRAAQDAGLSTTFLRANLYDRPEVIEIATRVREQLEPGVVYGRFLLHAIDDDGRENLWAFAGTALSPGGRIYVEFRTEPTKHEFGEHYRHFVDPDVVVAELEAIGGRVVRRLEGHGLAVYKNEDPHVCRLAVEL